jgi:hypothetical protein
MCILLVRGLKEGIKGKLGLVPLGGYILKKHRGPDPKKEAQDHVDLQVTA